MITEKARAKINLSLDVTGRRADGYHLVRMIMQSIELHDTVTVERGGGNIELYCSDASVPEDERNTAYRAAALLCDEFDIREGVRLCIDKRIPVAAGLAGGSSDAAAVFRGMNRLFSLGLDNGKMASRSLQIGADVPFCITGGTALAEGIGEKVTPLRRLPPMDIVLVHPGMKVSTAEVYGAFDMDSVEKRPNMEMLFDAIERKDIEALARNMINVLETVTVHKYSVISEIKDRLRELGAIGSLMSGSGPVVFGIFKNRSHAVHTCRKMSLQGYECSVTQMICEESKEWQENYPE